jgi:type I restriction enzyme S subunit
VSAAQLLRAGIFQDLKDGNHGGNHPKKSEFTNQGVPFITAAQVNNHALDFDGAYKLSGKPLERLRVGFAKQGDVIFTHKGSVGRTAITHADCLLTPQTTYYRVDHSSVCNRYLMWFLESDLFSDQYKDIVKQTTRDFLPITRQYELFHAIPPLAEQRRIVTKVDELMALCDRLEASLIAGDDTRRRLLDALLAEALTPEDALEREAAE